MKKDALLAEKKFFADITYKNLTGLTRSENPGLAFYAMELNKQKATEEGFKRFSWTFAEIFIEAYTNKKQTMSDRGVEKLIKKSLAQAWKKYNEK